MLLLKSTIKTNYDAYNDILYIHFDDQPHDTYADESPHGIEILRDMETDENVGLMIYYPRKHQAERQKTLDALGYGIDLKALCVV